MSKPSAKPTWQQEFHAGETAYRKDPGQSLRGKSDAFRQGFYSASSKVLLAGYTHRITYEAYAKALDMWCPAAFSTTKDAVRKSVRNLKKNGMRNIVVTELVAAKPAKHRIEPTTR